MYLTDLRLIGPGNGLQEILGPSWIDRIANVG